jgi:hypothetical protein
MLGRFIPDCFEPLTLANICVITRLSGNPIGPTNYAKIGTTSKLTKRISKGFPAVSERLPPSRRAGLGGREPDWLLSDLAARRGNDAVHADVFNQLTVVVGNVP